MSAAAAASEAASARATGFLASTLRVPVFTTNMYIGRVRFRSSSQRYVFVKILVVARDRGHYWMVRVRVNPGGMGTVSFAIFAGVGGRNP